MKRVYGERAKTVRKNRIMPALTEYEFDAVYALKTLYGVDNINEAAGRAIREAYELESRKHKQTRANYVPD
jgi:hypothetical protein